MTGSAIAALLLTTTSVPSFAVAADAGDLPPNAVPGHCYAKMLIPEEYETYTEQVVDQAARTELRIIPAVTTETEQRVVATEAYTEYTTIPATYRTVTETVVVKAASTRRVTVPAVYATETEQVLVREAHTVWKRGAPLPTDKVVPGSTHMIATGEVLCLVEVPAEYRTITRQVVRQAETYRDIPVAAETTTVTRQVVDQAARVVERVIPATYKTVRVTTITTPERTETITIPATYTTVTKQRLVRQSGFQWREVSCTPESGAPSTANLGYGPQRPPMPPPPPRPLPAPVVSSSRTTTTTTTTVPAVVQQRTTTTTTTSSSSYSSSSSAVSSVGGDTTVRQMQTALAARGYFKGQPNGLWGASTQDAMVRFQRDAKLPQGRLDAATAAALGLGR